jgi:hypothetical protein
VGVFLDVRDAAVPGNDTLQDLSAWLSTRAGEHGFLQAYLLAGCAAAGIGTSRKTASAPFKF